MQTLGLEAGEIVSPPEREQMDAPGRRRDLMVGKREREKEGSTGGKKRVTFEGENSFPLFSLLFLNHEKGLAA